MKIAVLMGGPGPERDVSLISGGACADALARKGHDVACVDVDHDLAARLAEIAPDLAFNALHGEWGEDGRVQGVLEMMGIAYTHSDLLASALAMDKHKTKIILETVGIPCPKGMLVNRFEAAKAHVMKPPYVAKPNAQGSSVGVILVPEGANQPPGELGNDDWPYGDEVLVEEFIPGRELTVAVMDDQPLAVTEIIAHRPFYNYEAKYADGGSSHVCPADIPDALRDKLMAQAVLAHKTLGCSGATRSDFRYDEINNQVRLLEINTQPGMTPTSLVPEQAAYRKIAFDDLVEWMAEHAVHPKSGESPSEKS